jgi:hypothetical protein
MPTWPVEPIRDSQQSVDLVHPARGRDGLQELVGPRAARVRVTWPSASPSRPSFATRDADWEQQPREARDAVSRIVPQKPCNCCLRSRMPQVRSLPRALPKGAVYAGVACISHRLASSTTAARCRTDVGPRRATPPASRSAASSETALVVRERSCPRAQGVQITSGEVRGRAAWMISDEPRMHLERAVGDANQPLRSAISKPATWCGSGTHADANARATAVPGSPAVR